MLHYITLWLDRTWDLGKTVEKLGLGEWIAWSRKISECAKKSLTSFFMLVEEKTFTRKCQCPPHPYSGTLATPLQSVLVYADCRKPCNEKYFKEFPSLILFSLKISFRLTKTRLIPRLTY